MWFLLDRSKTGDAPKQDRNKENDYENLSVQGDGVDQFLERCKQEQGERKNKKRTEHTGGST